MPQAKNRQTIKAANTVFHAHRWSAKRGRVRIDTLAPDQDSIGSMRRGDWVSYSRVDFGGGRFTLFMAFVAAATAGKVIEIRLDAPDGTVIGRLDVASTGAIDIFQEQYATVAGVSEIHDVYLVFPNGPVGVDWFLFSTDPDAEIAAQRDQRMQWWREARFGGFIHWGPYAMPAQGEWVMYLEQWSKPDYEAQAASMLDPTRFDARAWVSMAKQAGQKYLVITAKHHDGFSMYKTRVRGFDPIHHESSPGGYNIVDYTPYHSDPLLALSQECTRQGIKFCIYYSILDWHHGSQTPIYDGSGLTAIQPEQKARYVSQMKEQLRELVEGYHPDVLWFDGDWGGNDWWWAVDDGAALYRYLRVLRPSLVINERVKRDAGLGDFRSPEQVIPATGLPYDWETCMTMNGSWGYHAGDNDWKPVATLIRNLVDIASKGGNFLLNIGPKADGSVPQESIEQLKAIGEWMGTYGESIYATTASPFPSMPDWGRYTRKNGRLYAHVLDWPTDGELRIPRIRNAINRIYLVGRPEKSLSYTLEDTEIVIRVPAKTPDQHDSVITLDVAGIPIPYRPNRRALSSALQGNKP